MFGRKKAAKPSPNAGAYFIILSQVEWADNQKHRPTQTLLRQAHHMYWRGLNAFSKKKQWLRDLETH